MFKVTTLVLCLVSGPAFATTTAVLKTVQNKEVGHATFTKLANGVKIEIEASGLPPGEHAVHVHEFGKCEAPKFESAGGHFAPGHNPHGFDDAKGPHAGDMPNLVVGSDGKVKVELINVNVTLDKAETSLLRPGGTALIIHEKADDYKTQPTGNAGSRLACAVIKGA